jgi:hypothetical protein
MAFMASFFLLFFAKAALPQSNHTLPEFAGARSAKNIRLTCRTNHFADRAPGPLSESPPQPYTGPWRYQQINVGTNQMQNI